MRIILVNKFWYERGGSEKAVLLTKRLLEEAGHTVAIFGMKHPKNLFENKYFVENLDYSSKNIFKKIGFGLKAIYNREAARNFAALVKDFQPEVVHFHNFYHQLSWSVVVVAKRLGLKTVMTLHDYKLISPNYNLFHHGKIDESCTGGKYYRCVLNNCLEDKSRSLLAALEAYAVDFMGYKNLIDQYISPSIFLRDKFIAAGFSENKILQLNNPVGDNFFESSISAPLDYVAFFGRLSKEKGLDQLLAAAMILKDIKFKIVGQGPLEAELKQKISDNKLLNVEMIGFKTGTELVGLMDKARVVVVPSVWYENTPTIIAELSARGQLVVASDLGSIREMLPAELLADPNDAVRLAEKIKYWFEVGAEKRGATISFLTEIAKKRYDSKRYLEALLKIYQI